MTYRSEKNTRQNLFSPSASTEGPAALFNHLPAGEQQFIKDKAEAFHLSFQQTRKLIEAAADLLQWEEPPVSSLWNDSAADGRKGKDRGRAILTDLDRQMGEMRSNPISYEGFSDQKWKHPSYEYVVKNSEDETILGTCPVAGEKTRCCNLQTLDAVEQCGYGCSYCSIQSFYDSQKIFFHGDLARKLIAIEKTLDPDTLYHIGTGQSSDSLMWGNRNGLLSDLFAFAQNNPNVILELKTKSAVTAWADELDIPPNVIATWSLNAPTIIRHEEHGTADLEARLSAAEKLASAGVLVGFHFHPIVYFSDWEHEYTAIVKEIERRFTPEMTAMISLGTLTFIKPVLKKLRASGQSSKVLQIPMADSAGKYTYPEETKAVMFSHVFNSFSPEWKQSVFFYLCMEPHTLWHRVLGRSYPDNEAFEASMKSAYMDKVILARELKRKYNT
jgi:spore photoproduct lyase